MADITITHTRADGTLVDGSRKGDGVFELIRPHGFRYFRSLGCLGIGHSRDRQAQMWKINPAAEALRAAGHTVTIEIDEDQRRTFAEAEADRLQRAEDRTERFADRADRATHSADSRFEAARQITRGIPFGQPILIGHHSEARARRDAARIDSNMRAGIAERKRAGYWEDRARAADNYERYRTNPARTLRRIANLEADLRRIKKWQAGQPAGGYTRALTPETVAELGRRELELTEELEHWRGIIAQAEAAGFKVWGKADFVKGDYVRIGSRWYEVLRVNAKSLTVPGGPDFRPVVSSATRAYSWDDRMPYDGVSGRMSADEMRKKLAAAASSDRE